MRKLTCVEFWNRCIVRWRFSLFPMFRVWCWSRCLRRILLKRRQTAHFELGYTRSRKSCCSGLSWESGTVSFKVYVSSLVDVTFSRVSNYRFDAHYDVLKTLIVCNPDTITPNKRTDLMHARDKKTQIRLVWFIYKIVIPFLSNINFGVQLKSCSDCLIGKTYVPFKSQLNRN